MFIIPSRKRFFLMQFFLQFFRFFGAFFFCWPKVSCRLKTLSRRLKLWLKVYLKSTISWLKLKSRPNRQNLSQGFGIFRDLRFRGDLRFWLKLFLRPGRAENFQNTKFLSMKILEFPLVSEVLRSIKTVQTPKFSALRDKILYCWSLTSSIPEQYTTVMLLLTRHRCCF